MAVDWSQLPSDLLESVSRKLPLYADYVRFRAVCRAWRSSTPKAPSHLPPQLPWLLLPLFKPQSRGRSCSGYFYSLPDNKVHVLRITETCLRKRRCGSSHGWLAILDESPSVVLVNPLTGAKVDLPPLHTFPDVVGFNFADVGREYLLRDGNHRLSTRNLKQMRDIFVKKVVLSSSPAKDSRFVAVAMLHHRSRLAYCRNGDEGWRFIEEANFYSDDVIYRDGLFYAVSSYGRIAVCDVNGDSPRVSYIDKPRVVCGDIQYLVSVGDDLMLVTRHLDSNFWPELHQTVFRTKLFDVFKLGDEFRWEWVADLGDYMIFIGQNSSFALRASDFPGCMGNCIYYTDDHSDSNCDGFLEEQDMGIFRLEDESFEKLPCYSPNFASPSTPPIWFSPNPC
ncbi:F-box protein SKIP23-like [Syzygium oleosum]|uniref:F-box protein SKIP23-like n=1 Tax=Syzygium oleosum TaxID=219896 RepID=UPI0024B9E112|nr:F-box protein SKIP23-like [Syzygium oleosum]XP_056163975.1 F-box protein SKIP23-like [Syzygium oleosum]